MTPTPTPAPAPAPTPAPAPVPAPVAALGVDIAANQGITPAITDATHKFVIVKATEGIGYDSPQYAAQVAAVRAAGKRVGAYHYAWANQDPAAEAAHFLKVANLQPGDLACLDLESSTDGATWQTRTTYALAWLAAVKTATKCVPFIYMNWAWIKGIRTAATPAQWAELVGYPLWLADYDSHVAGTFPTVNPQAPGGPTFTVVIHQWTDNDGGLDGDWTADLAALANYAVPA